MNDLLHHDCVYGITGEALRRCWMLGFRFASGLASHYRILARPRMGARETRLYSDISNRLTDSVVSVVIE